MIRSVAREARTIGLAVIVASVIAPPSVALAAYVANADRVEQKHAVGSDASASSRRGKLVATDPTTGRLPNNIIAKAANSDQLDGLDSTDFAKGAVHTAIGSANIPAGTVDTLVDWSGGTVLINLDCSPSSGSLRVRNEDSAPLTLIADYGANDSWFATLQSPTQPSFSFAVGTDHFALFLQKGGESAEIQVFAKAQAETCLAGWRVTRSS